MLRRVTLVALVLSASTACASTPAAESPPIPSPSLPTVTVPNSASSSPTPRPPADSGSAGVPTDSTDAGSLTEDAQIPEVGQDRPSSNFVVPPPPALPSTPPPRPSEEDLASGTLTAAQRNELIAALRAVSGFFNADQGSLDAKVAFVENGESFSQYMSSTAYLLNRPGVFAKVGSIDLVYEGGCAKVFSRSQVPVKDPCLALDLEFWQEDTLLKQGIVVYAYRASSGWKLAHESFCYAAWAANPADPPCSGY